MAALFAEAVQQMADPGDADALDTLAICLARIGRYEQAAETAARAAAGKIPDVYNQSLILLRLELFRAKKPYLPESFTADGPKGGKP